ncbi:MAG: DUF2332 family protein, partial [Proteobacteria bacterium]|nr:DUF2332 family protein [Pseudomonadota bacterium]
PRDARLDTLKGMQAASAARAIDFVSLEGSGDGCSELHATAYRDGTRETQLLARCNPHGRWIEWMSG